jgi:hypothetical protein
MTIDYAELHADIEVDFTEYGASCTFTHTSQGTRDETTDEFSGPVTTTVAGRAVSVRGNGERYKQLVLVKTEVLTLLFWPATFGDKPLAGYSVTWSGEVYTVDHVAQVAPAGDAIISRVLVSR